MNLALVYLYICISHRDAIWILFGCYDLLQIRVVTRPQKSFQENGSMRTQK